ncbi:MAG: hypothetical protein ACK5XN_15290, partial [Bacteroidota bacterium]
MIITACGNQPTDEQIVETRVAQGIQATQLALDSTATAQAATNPEAVTPLIVFATATSASAGGQAPAATARPANNQPAATATYAPVA